MTSTTPTHDPLPISPEMQTKLQAAQQACSQKVLQMGQLHRQMRTLERAQTALEAALDNDEATRERLMREAAISVGINLDAPESWVLDTTVSGPWAFTRKT